MLVCQKIMFDRNGYTCITLKLWKTLRKVLSCIITIMARKRMKDSHVLKTPVPEQRLKSS